MWLIPPRESAVELIFAREKLAALPASVAARLTDSAPPEGSTKPEDR